MNKLNFAIVCAIVIAMGAMMGACKGGGSKSAVTQGDTLAIANMQLADSSSFTKSNGERCAISATANIDYPAGLADTTTLMKLFTKYVLESDTLAFKDASRLTVTNSLHQYDFLAEAPEDSDEPDDDLEATYRYNTTCNIRAFYNRNDLVTFCRVDVIKKNDVISSVTHKYYTFDLANMSYVDQTKMFREDALGDVAQLLRNTLLRQNKVANNEQLNELGYYNAENISTTTNFFITDNGVTWSFLPNELAVEAVGEPQISVSFEDLEPFRGDSSVLKRLF